MSCCADEHFAFSATKNRLELAKKLVVLGANIDAHGINENAADVPIILSARAGYLELLEFLIAAEADVNTSTYATALHLAANIEIAGALIIAGANIHAKTESGAIVRDLLSSSNKPDIVKLIDKTEILYHIIDGNLSYVDKLVEDLTLKEAKIFKAIFDNNFVGNVDGLSSISIMLYEFISRFIDDQTSVWAYDDLHQGEPASERAELDLTGNVENSCLIGIMDNAIEE